MAGGIDVWLAGPRRYGNRVRHAARLHAGGKDADRTAILDALRVLIVAQILFALALVLCAISFAPDADLNGCSVLWLYRPAISANASMSRCCPI